MDITYEAKNHLANAQNNLEYIEQSIDELGEASKEWGIIEDEGYSNGQEVVEIINEANEWLLFAEQESLSVGEVEEKLLAYDELADVIGYVADEAGVPPFTDLEGAKLAVDCLKEGDFQAMSGVVNALQVLVKELQKAKILPGTAFVPAPVDDTGVVNPPNEMSFTSTEAAVSDNETNAASV